MIYLILVTLLWAFSFSLIGEYLAGVDPWFSVLLRTGLALLVFLPFLRKQSGIDVPILKLALIGAVQLGLMYGFYYHAFLYLSVPEVLLFTVVTPIYVTLFNDILDRQFHRQYFYAALLAVAGAIAIRYDTINTGFIVGLLLVQCANVCFAVGQVSYKRLIGGSADLTQHQIFAWFFVGAFLLSCLTYALFGDTTKLPTTNSQWGILLYLGLVASGLGYFAWNKGATMVNTGTLAAMNNLLIPAGLIVNVVIWNRDADLPRLLLGGTVIVISIWVGKKVSRSG